jgi:hypothetical protein
VLLQIMTFTTDVAADLKAVGQPDSRHFTQCRVRLLRCRGILTVGIQYSPAQNKTQAGEKSPACEKRGNSRDIGPCCQDRITTILIQITSC